MIKTSLPKSEYRRVYFKELVAEYQAMFDITPNEAKVCAERQVLYLRAKFKADDEIFFGTGKVTFNEYKPRIFNLITGKGVNKRKEVHVGSRKKWFVKFFASHFRD